MFNKNPIDILLVVLGVFFLVLVIAVRSRFDRAEDMKKGKGKGE